MSRRNSLIDPTTIRAFGPGLAGGRVGDECKFRIEGTDGGLALSFHIEGPSKPMFETCAGRDLSLDITYIPVLPVSSMHVTEAKFASCLVSNQYKLTDRFLLSGRLIHPYIHPS